MQTSRCNSLAQNDQHSSLTPAHASGLSSVQPCPVCSYSCLMQTIRCGSLSRLDLQSNLALALASKLMLAWPCLTCALQNQPQTLTDLWSYPTQLDQHPGQHYMFTNGSYGPPGRFPKLLHQAHSQTQISCVPVGASPRPSIICPSILAFV